MKKQYGKNKLVITKEFTFDRDNYLKDLKLPLNKNIVIVTYIAWIS